MKICQPTEQTGFKGGLMQQAADFFEETGLFFQLIEGLDESMFEQETLFKNWTINDILVHLHFWNKNADSSLNEPGKFDEMMEDFFSAIQKGQLRSYENRLVSERGHQLLRLWFELSQKIAKDFATVDPKQRVKWAGPGMSARTCISARQMEVWAHGQAVFDLLGKERSEGDRIKNVVVLGINAFGWSHHVHGLAMPQAMPFLKLKSPPGDVWEFGKTENTNSIEGTAVEFSQVVTQTRNIADTSLKIVGEISKTWMENAQCFAGPPENPPKPGNRKRSQ